MAQFRQFVDENLSSNYRANFIHGVLGMTGFRLIYAPTIIPAYVLLLTGSTAAVGVSAAVLQFGSMISPIVSGSRIEGRSHILSYAVKVGSLMRSMVLGLALAGWFLTGDIRIAITFICLFFLGVFSGAQRVAFQTLISKLIPIEKRGRLQGYRNFAGGMIAAVLAWAAGNYLIADNWLGNGYSTVFLFAFLLTTAGLIVLKTMIREPASPSSKAPMNVFARMREFPELLRAKGFAPFLLVHCFSSMARVSAPFCTVYAASVLGLDGALIGGLSFAFLGSDTISNIIWGPLGDKFGFRLVYILSLSCSIGGMLLLLSADSALPIYAAFILLGSGASGWMLSASTMVLEFGEMDDTPMRLALMTTAEGAVTASLPIIAGLSVVASGFMPLFWTVAASLIIAMAVLVVKVAEPRSSSATKYS